MRTLSNQLSPNQSPKPSPGKWQSNSITSPQSAPAVPKWKAKLKERNRLAAPPLHKLESLRSLTLETTDEQKAINDEFNPLFDSLTSIEYSHRPEDDDLAASLYGSSSAILATPKKSPKRKVENKRISGYDFDSLIGEEI